MNTPNKTSLFSMNVVYNDMNNDIRRDANQNNKFGGRSGIIWNLIFMIPVVFTSMIHDSYKNFLPDSWFTKTFDDLFIKWISQRLLCLVLHSFFFLECSNFRFYSELYRFLDHCFSVSSFVLSRYGVLLLNIKHQCHWRNKRTISPECTNYIGGSGGSSPGKKLKIGLSETPYISCIPWIERN